MAELEGGGVERSKRETDREGEGHWREGMGTGRPSRPLSQSCRSFGAIQRAANEVTYF